MINVNREAKKHRGIGALVSFNNQRNANMNQSSRTTLPPLNWQIKTLSTPITDDAALKLVTIPTAGHKREL